MRLKILSLAVPVFACLLTTGCDQAAKAPEPPPEPLRVAYSTLTRERRTELANAMVAALMEFDDLYGTITATVDESDGALNVTAGDKAKPESVGRALAIALANFEFRAPGVRYVSTGDRTWKVLLPDDMQVAAEGKFDFRLP